MPHKHPSSTVYSLILRRSAMAVIEKPYIFMTASALSSLGAMNKELFVHLSESFLQGKSPATTRITTSAGISLVRSYSSRPKMHAETWLAEVIQRLEKYADSLRPREIVQLIGVIASSRHFSSNMRAQVGKFLPMAVTRGVELDPVTFTLLVQHLGSLKALKSLHKIIESIPKVFAESTLNELCGIICMLRTIQFYPADAGKFLVRTLVKHPEKHTLSYKQAEKVLLAIPMMKPRASHVELLLNSLKGKCQQLKSRSIHRIIDFISMSPLLRKHPITTELCEALCTRKKHFHLHKILSMAFILNRFTTTGEIRQTVDELHLALVDRFEKLSSEYYLMLLCYAVKVLGHKKFKREIYTLMEHSFGKLERVNTQKESSVSTTDKCIILCKVIELRCELHLKSSLKKIFQYIDHLLASNPDFKSMYHLFFIFPLLGPRTSGVAGKLNKLCDQMLGFLTEMNFNMCVKIIIAMEKFSINTKVLQNLAERIRLFLEKNRGELTIPLQQLEVLISSKAIYQAVSKAKWGLLLGDNIALTIQKEKPSLDTIARSLFILTDNAMQLTGNIATFIDIILEISPDEHAKPCEINSLVYFVASYVDLNSIRNVVKHILSLCDGYTQFTLQEVTYILSVLKDRGCERSEIPSGLTSFLYSLKSSSIAPGDLSALFGLLPHFEIDVNPVVYNLLNQARGPDGAWVACATPQDLVEVMANLLGTVDMVQGPFIDAITARLEKLMDSATGPEVIQIVFAILRVTVVHQRSGKPAFMHKAINRVSQKVDSLRIRDIILFLKTVQISAHIYTSTFLRPFVNRMRKVLQEEPKTSLVELNSALHGFYRVGLSAKTVFADAWEFAYLQLTRNPQPRTISDPKFVDRLLNTMITSNIVHAKLAQSLISMIPRFEDKSVPFSVACRLYNSCVKLLRIDPNFVAVEIIDKLKHLCMLNIFNSPMPLHVLQFVESVSIRHTSFNADFDEESVSAILILAPRINGMKHHLTTHCMNLIFKHLQAFDIDPRNDEWLSEHGKVRQLVDAGYITTTHVLRFADTYSKYFKKEVASIDIQDAFRLAKN
ncbi:spermine synthase [Perkinsela sp. CCAP 1560/4]|nr:spermine synthase [Perkinsela sp. CCAP 1560/4]|eukprot:KNH08067.1 spermine synthase [Perkinsela sp. CCAP 1560/4]